MDTATRRRHEYRRRLSSYPQRRQVGPAEVPADLWEESDFVRWAVRRDGIDVRLGAGGLPEVSWVCWPNSA